MANTTIKELINNSIRVYAGMISVWPQLNREGEVNFDVATFNGCYAVNNGTLAFVIDRELYVTPVTREVYQVLRENNFTREYFYVPFSNGDYPKVEKCRWEWLWEMARKSHEEEFVEKCCQYCDEHGIGELDANILKNCFVMPEKGVRVKHIHFEDVYYPVIIGSCWNCDAADYIGTYSRNNGRVVFVYRDGKTYVTKGYKILEELRRLGYEEKDLFVPFSNCEQIIDPVLAEQWELIKK